jgi:paraquat-inducible protein A
MTRSQQPPSLAPSSSEPQLRSCPGCGLVQGIASLAPGSSAVCARCATTLRRFSRHRLEHIGALTFAAFVLLVVMCSSNLMSVQKAGIRHVASLFSGPEELVYRNMAVLAAVVLFVTVVAPLARLVGIIYVLTRSRDPNPPSHLKRVLAWTEKLRPWSMIDVFVFGVFVAYVKLGDLVTIGLSAGVYALFALTFVLVWVDSAFDREALWERLAPEAVPVGPTDAPVGAVGCEACGFVNGALETSAASREGPFIEPKPAARLRRQGLLLVPETVGKRLERFGRRTVSGARAGH